MNASPVMLITGSRKGIGKFLATHYLGRGYTVVGCSREPSDIISPHYVHFCLDVADEPAVRNLFASIRSDFKRLDVLINNAGIASMNHAMLTPISTVQRIMNTNVVGTFLFCRESAKLMKAARVGRIVNFVSVAAPLRLEGEAIYAASKAAVMSLTAILSREFSECGITVNAIGPTPIETDLIRSVPREKIDILMQRQAIHRLGTFEDIRNVIDFFISPQSEFITGQVLYLGGVG